MISPELLRRYAFFAGFSNAQLKQLAMAAAEEQVAAGSVLFSEGEHADHFFFLAEGEVESVIHAEGQDIPVSTIPPGEPVGWSALIEPRIYTASCRTTRPSRVIRFGYHELGHLLDVPEFSALLMKKVAEVVSRRLRDMQLQVVSLSTHA